MWIKSWIRPKYRGMIEQISIQKKRNKIYSVYLSCTYNSRKHFNIHFFHVKM